MGVASISIDSVPSTSFTPQESLVELLRICLNKNVAPFLAEANDKPFLVTWLIKEWCRNLTSQNEIILFVVDSEEKVSLWNKFLDRMTCNHQSVIISTIENLENDDSKKISLIVVDNAQRLMLDEKVTKIVSKRPDRVISLTSNILKDENHSQILQPKNLESILESTLNKHATIAPEGCSDLLSMLRFFCHPSEQIVVNESQPSENSSELNSSIDAIVKNCYDFFKSHHFSLLEIYGAEFQDLIEDVPDPAVLPLKLLDDFVYIKETLGLWSAERAALLLIIKIDKLKTREKYERHFLLLSVLYTEMVKIRKICENAFENLSEVDKLMQYSTPKLLRLVQVLRQYKPEHVCRQQPKPSEKENEESVATATVEKQRRGRSKGYSSYDDPNALCGAVFVQNKFLAKLLYHFLKDLSRSDDAYSFLMPQYATDLHSEEILEEYDIEVESKRQEDSLRRFRMKESNLLISSSHLDVGVDNVRCNLVIAFDTPKTFKQYTSYKVKAKASKSHFLIFCHQDDLKEMKDKLNQFAHTESILKSFCTVPEICTSKNADLVPTEAKISPESDRKFNPFYSINRYCSKLPSDTL